MELSHGERWRWKDNLDFTTLVGLDDLVDPSECYLGTLVGVKNNGWHTNSTSCCGRSSSFAEERVQHARGCCLTRHSWHGEVMTLWRNMLVKGTANMLRGLALRVCWGVLRGSRMRWNSERWSWIRMTIVSWVVLESIWTRNKLELNSRISAIKFNFSFTTCNNT